MRYIANVLLLLGLIGCASPQVQNVSGIPARRTEPGMPGPVQGIGIEGSDVVAMTDQMMRDMLANPKLAGAVRPPRVVIDSRYFKNTGTQIINRDLITARLRVNLNRVSQGRMMFIVREDLSAVQQERDLKRQGVTDVGTIGMTQAMAGADYVLKGEIATLDSASKRAGINQRYNQISFEMIDAESGGIVWSGLYEFTASAADDVVYR